MRGARLYVTAAEAAELLTGEVPTTVADKLARCRQSPDQIKGQTTIYDQLEESCAQRPATTE